MTAPDTLPLLTPGTHLSPDDGACLMELVSVLAGEPWSDQPACTDRTLATIARVVNDELSDTARPAIARLAADLVGRTGDPTRLAPALVESCLAAARRYLPHVGSAVHRHQRRAARRVNSVLWSGRRRVLSGWLYARGPAQHAITAMVLALRQLPGDARDEALHAVLTTAIDVAHRMTGDDRPAESTSITASAVVGP